jgi:hypothetical protein
VEEAGGYDKDKIILNQKERVSNCKIFEEKKNTKAKMIG